MSVLLRSSSLTIGGLLLCAWVMYGQTPGDSPDNPISIGPGLTTFAAPGTPYALPSTPPACAVTDITNVNALWFELKTPKENKILDIVAYSQLDPVPMVILVFRKLPQGTVQVGCHLNYGTSETFFGNRSDSTYLVMVGVMSGPLEGGIVVTTSQAGVLRGSDSLDNYINYSAQIGESDENGYTTIAVESTGATCDTAATNPVNVRWTILRTGVKHEREGGKLYTAVFRVQGDVFAWPDGWWFQNMGATICDTIAKLPVARGIVQYSYYDNNYYLTGGKDDHVGFHIAGSLTDLTGTCPGNKTHLTFIAELLYPYECPQCGQVRHWDGPRLSCTN